MSSSVALVPAAAVVAVDVGKAKAAVLVTDAARRRLLGPMEFPMTAVGLGRVITRRRLCFRVGRFGLVWRPLVIITSRCYRGRCGRAGRWWS